MTSYNWTERLRAIYDKAVDLYRNGNRDFAAYFNLEESEWLASVGLRPINVYDWAEDMISASEPSWDIVLLIAAARRDYFLVHQKGVTATTVTESSELTAKDAELEGIPWLPRIIAKATCFLRGGPLPRDHVLLRRGQMVPQGTRYPPGRFPSRCLGLGRRSGQDAGLCQQRIRLELRYRRSALPDSSPLVGIDIVEHRLDLVAVLEPALFLAADQDLVRLIAPSALAHKSIPDLNLLGGRLRTTLHSPSPDPFIIETFLHFGRQILVRNTEKLTAAVIETLPKIGNTVLCQLTGGMETDLLYHAGKVNKPMDRDVGAEWSFHAVLLAGV